MVCGCVGAWVWGCGGDAGLLKLHQLSDRCFGGSPVSCMMHHCCVTLIVDRQLTILFIQLQLWQPLAGVSPLVLCCWVCSTSSWWGLKMRAGCRTQA